MDKYTTIETIGEGAHGLILKAKCLQTGKEIALKKVYIKNIHQGIPTKILREIKSMQLSQSKYVMELNDYFPQGSSLVFVFPLMPSGLSEMISDYELNLNESHWKAYMKMLLMGVRYLHENGIIHRDLKPANLLIGFDGILRIGDFGLARPFKKESKEPLTSQVATRWYRAPELLYGARYYDVGVDLWAVGCILAEIINKSPLFPGETDIDQLALVVSNLGTPNEKNWPGVSKLPDYNKITFASSKPTPWNKLLLGASDDAVDLVKLFVQYDSDKRITAKNALNHMYFFTKPLPCNEDKMPRPSSDHREKLKDRMKLDNISPNKMFDNFKNLLLEYADNED